MTSFQGKITNLRVHQTLPQGHVLFAHLPERKEAWDHQFQSRRFAIRNVEKTFVVLNVLHASSPKEKISWHLFADLSWTPNSLLREVCCISNDYIPRWVVICITYVHLSHILVSYWLANTVSPTWDKVEVCHEVARHSEIAHSSMLLLWQLKCRKTSTGKNHKNHHRPGSYPFFKGLHQIPLI